MPQLASITGDLYIAHNRTLVGWSLDSLREVAGDTTIIYNDLLSECRAVRLLERTGQDTSGLQHYGNLSCELDCVDGECR